MRLLKILNEREKFSAVEQAIIEYILKNPKEIVNMSIRELGNKTATSGAAIFRLCQKCGLKGYTEFKVKFVSEVNRTIDAQAEELNIPIRDLNRPINGSDTVKSVIQKMAFLEVEAIEETKNEINLAQLENIVDALDEARQILFFGFDLNYFIAQSTVYHLVQARKDAFVYESLNSQLSKAICADKRDVAILISRTGENRRLIEIIKVLKKKKIKTILLSSNKSTTLYKLCDEFVYIANTEEYLNMGGLIFSVGCRYILDVIFGALVARNYDAIEKFYVCFENINGGPNDRDRLW